MITVPYPLVWDELLSFALMEEEALPREGIQDALDDFGVDPAPAKCKVFAALRRLKVQCEGGPSDSTTDTRPALGATG